MYAFRFFLDVHSRYHLSYVVPWVKLMKSDLDIEIVKPSNHLLLSTVLKKNIH
jgi:hypothetical protein